MPTKQVHVTLTDEAPEITSCHKCDSPTCLALVRADDPPVGLFDFLDRQLKLISSGHWSWSTMGYCAVLVTLVLVTVPILIYICSVAGPVVGGTAGLVTGTSIVGGAGLYLRWRRNRTPSDENIPAAPIAGEPRPAEEEQTDWAA